MVFDNVIFDFDGTIADTQEGILNSIRYALGKLNKPIPSDDVMCGFIGPALYDSYQRITHLSEEEAIQGIRIYRENYVPRGVYQCKLYDGMNELIGELKAKAKLSIASAKPQRMLETAASHLGVIDRFDKVVGADESDRMSEKTNIIKAAIAGNSPVMVGDTIYDVSAAKNAGVPVIAVGYGFMDKARLTAAKPDYYAETVDDLRKILLG